MRAPNKNNLKFSRALVALRKKQGWTQKQLAKAIGVGEFPLIQWEKGRYLPTEKNFRQILVTLGRTSEIVDCYYTAVGKRRGLTRNRNAIKNDNGESFGSRLHDLIVKQMLSIEYISDTIKINPNAIRRWLVDFQMPSRKSFDKLLELVGIDLPLVDLYERNCRAVYNWNVYRQSNKTSRVSKITVRSPKIAFGQDLRTARLLLNLRQADVAADINVSTSSISLWELGWSLPEPGRFKKLAAVIELPGSVIETYYKITGGKNEKDY